MTVSLEWLSETIAIVRLHERGGLGDPYFWSAVAVAEGEVFTIKGMLQAPPLEGLRRMTELARRMGFTRRRHERIQGGRVRYVERRISSPKEGLP